MTGWLLQVLTDLRAGRKLRTSDRSNNVLLPDKLLQVQILKEEQLIAKAKAESRASNLDSARKAVATWIFAYGVLGTFSYNFFDIHFFPSGLTTGDVLFYTFVSLALGLVSALLAACGCFLFVPVSMYQTTTGRALRYPPPSGAGCEVSTWMFFVSGFWPILTGMVLAQFHLKEDWWTVVPLMFVSASISVMIILIASAPVPPASCLHRLPLGWGRRSLPSDEKWMFGSIYVVLAPGLCWLFAASGAGKAAALFAVVLPGFAVALALQLLDDPAPPIPRNVEDAALKTEEEKRSFRLRLASLLAVIAISAPSLFLTDARAYVFTALGFRASEVSLSLNATNLGLVRGGADAAGITLSVCQGRDGSAIVTPIDVRWHGVGNRTLVSLPRPQGTQTAVELELAADGVKVIRNSKERCVDVAETALFDFGSSTFLGRMEPETALANLEEVLQPQLTALSGRWKVRELVITGHADPMPLTEGGNAALGQKRADAVKTLLCKSSKLAPLMMSTTTIRSRTAGAREPLKICPDNTSRDVQRECNEINRRVEIRMRVEPATDKGNTAPLTDSQKSISAH